MDSVNDKSVEKALDFYRDNAKPYAHARALSQFLEQKRKSLKAAAMLESKKPTIAEREAEAYTDDEYKQCLKEQMDATYEATLLFAQMKAAELKIEVWRSLNARANRGHV